MHKTIGQLFSGLLQKRSLLLLFLILMSHYSNAQSTTGYTYTLIKYLEYPNKNSNTECYVALPKLYSTDTLKLIMNRIRKEKSTADVSVFYHFVKGRKVVSRVRDRFQVNFNTYKDNLKFYSDTVSGNRKNTLSLILKSDSSVLMQNMIGLWQFQYNDHVVCFIYKKKDGSFYLNTFDVAEKKSTSTSKLELITEGKKKYYTCLRYSERYYYFVNEFNDVEIYADTYGYKKAFLETWYLVGQ